MFNTSLCTIKCSDAVSCQLVIANDHLGSFISTSRCNKTSIHCPGTLHNVLLTKLRSKIRAKHQIGKYYFLKFIIFGKSVNRLICILSLRSILNWSLLQCYKRHQHLALNITNIA